MKLPVVLPEKNSNPKWVNFELPALPVSMYDWIKCKHITNELQSAMNSLNSGFREELKDCNIYGRWSSTLS